MIKTKSNKKAQVTVFIIIGILLLAGAATFFYIVKKTSQESKLEAEIQVSEEQVPTQFNPIKKYAEDCAYSVAVDGLKLVGQHGGYISFDDNDLNKESFLITPNPTESDAVQFSPNSDLKTAYWWYLKSANDCTANCQFATKRPDLRDTDNSIEKQLERYVDAKYRDCINNFEQFKQQGFVITEQSAPKTNVVIAADDIKVLVEYPINAKLQDSQSEMSKFLVTVPIDLDNIYRLATNITNMEIKYHYIEKHALNLIVAFSGVSEDKLPPTNELQFKLGNSVSWIKNDVKNEITGMLTSYVPLFQVDGTYNFEQNVFDDDLSRSLYESTIIPVRDPAYSSLAPSFTYLDLWPAYFNLNCEGQFCRASTANSLIQLFGIQDYRFVYDLSFPVHIEVNDPFALNGLGYTFNFFLEGNIRDNEPMTSDYQGLSALPVSSGKSQLCDLRTSGDVTINVKDAVTDESLNEAQVLYKVGDESCYIGQTLSPLVERFPVAVGGVLSVSKDSYIGKYVNFSPEADVEKSLDVELQPVYTKNAIIRKINVTKTNGRWVFTNNREDLTNNELAFITLRRVGAENEQEFSSIASYKGGEQPTQIDIAPGIYEVEGSLILNERIVVPEREACSCIIDTPIGCASENCYTIPEIDFGKDATPGEEQFPSGGLKTRFTISPNRLANNENIVFYVLNINIAGIPQSQRVVEDLDELGKIEEYSTIYRTNLQPTFS